MQRCNRKYNQTIHISGAEMAYNLQSDNPEDFIQLYDRFSPAVLGLIIKWINDQDIAETLLKGSFCKSMAQQENV